MPSNYYSSRFFSPNPTVTLRDANILKLTLVSATNLPYSPRLSGQRMQVYAKASLAGGAAKRSGVDCEEETNPTWDFPVKFRITESTCKTGGNLVVNLYSKRTFVDKCIGEVKIRVEDLFEKWLDSKTLAAKHVVGTADGVLNIVYAFEMKR